MALDQALVLPVSHYIGGMIGAATATLTEVQVKGKLPELTVILEQAKESCLSRCQDLLGNPAKYAKKPDYVLDERDRAFLRTLLEMVEHSDWQNPAEVRVLSNFVDGYLPKGNLLS